MLLSVSSIIKLLYASLTSFCHTLSCLLLCFSSSTVIIPHHPDSLFLLDFNRLVTFTSTYYSVCHFHPQPSSCLFPPVHSYYLKFILLPSCTLSPTQFWKTHHLPQVWQQESPWHWLWPHTDRTTGSETVSADFIIAVTETKMVGQVKQRVPRNWPCLFCGCWFCSGLLCGWFWLLRRWFWGLLLVSLLRLR